MEVGRLLEGWVHVKAILIALLGPLVSVLKLVFSIVCSLHKSPEVGGWKCSFVNYSWVSIPINLYLN